MTQGDKGLAVFLKSCAVSLQQASSGYIIEDLTQIGPRVSRTKGGGLPRIIPTHHRLIIKNRQPGYLILIRFYLSVFYLYRVIEFLGPLKLKTITAPGRSFDMGRFAKYISGFNKLMRKNRESLSDPSTFLAKRFQMFPIFKSSSLTGRVAYNSFKPSVNFKQKP